MPHVITNECISCGACAIECPIPACISEGDATYVIDFAACTDCGACPPVCPVDAIVTSAVPRVAGR